MRSKKVLPYCFIILSGLFLLGMGQKPKTPVLETVPSVDLERYLGQWYEIARYENSFQENCVGTTATYSMRDDGKIKVVNKCYKENFDGRLEEAVGKAWVVDTETNAKLKVQFFWPFAGNYWIIDLDPDYQYAVVGEPDRDYLWILSRTPTLNEETYHEIEKLLIKQSYDPSKLIPTLQKK